jgi:nicotinate-nucleotide adenylyltransferase
LDLPISEIDYRMSMLTQAIKDNPDFSISRVDIDRPPPYYSVDTVQLLSQAYPQEKLIYLMGEDSLNDLPNWHKPVEFVAACDGIGVMRRPGEEPTNLVDLEALVPGLTAKVCFFAAPLLDISSSDIRSRVAQGLPYRYFLPPGIYEIIQANHLYQN